MTSVDPDTIRAAEHCAEMNRFDTAVIGADGFAGLGVRIQSMTTLDTVSDYIRSQWDASVRCGVAEPGIVSVPVPHTVPSPAGRFKALFYWDTYFTNLGLLRSGRIDLARSNCNALLWWIDQLGFVPNSAFVHDSNRSQPPFLAMMVREVYDVTKDRAWLAQAVPRLVREHSFWMERRTFADGLAHHGHHADDGYLESFYDGILHRRLGVNRERPREAKLELAGQLLAEAETGQDFTPVYQHRVLHHADVGLNTLLWTYEESLAFFLREVEAKSEAIAEWEHRAARRAEAVRTRLWDAPAGLFRPLDMISQCHAEVAYLGTFYPLWAGLATPEQAREVRGNLSRFEREFGVAQTEPCRDPGHQWAFPNGWPPTHWLVARGLQRYGYLEDAQRIARKYCELQRRMFAETGTLWEKFDVTSGKQGGEEYEADPMLGWTAGVFLAMREVMENGDSP